MLLSIARRMRAGLTSALAMAAMVAASTIAASAQSTAVAQQPTGLRGTITTQHGVLAVPGVVITVFIETPVRATIAETTTDQSGRYEIRDVPPGAYTVQAFLDGFAEQRHAVQIEQGREREVSFDLEIAKMATTVDVTAGRTTLPLEASPAVTAGNGTSLEIGPIKGDNFEALLPILPGIMRMPDGHISMKGAAPTQSSVQLNAANVTDPSTGNLGFDLPNDAVASVEVQTNPYAAEFGRFSSGVTTLNTAHGGSSWSFTPNGFYPRFYHDKNDWWNVTGIRSFRPRFALGGPIVKDKVFLFENVLYRYYKTPVPDLPGDQFTRVSEVKTFSRLDVNVSPTNVFNTTVATFPQQADFANLNTFNYVPVSTNFRQGGYNVAAADRATLGALTLLESTIAVKHYNVRVLGQGRDEMEITPEGNFGNYFNRQERRTTTYQWVEALTTTVSGTGGEHLLKFASDVLQVGYDGTSDSSAVNVRREDASVVERIVFGGPTVQAVSSFEAALVAQDHWRPNDRLLIEAGARLDRDGVLDRLNFTPRLGTVIGILPEGRTIARGGIGLFYDRTPLNVGAFESFETRTITQYGPGAASAPVTFVNRVGSDLRTPHSRIWNVELDHRVNDIWSVKVNHLERAGHHEFVVNPIVGGGAPEILLTTSGESRYRETEFGVRYAPGPRAETTVSYVRSHGAADLNNYDQYFGNARNPIIQPNQYGLIPTDAPNRIVVRGSYLLPWQIQFDPLVDIRDGFPYSMVAEDQSYVGQRNGAGRFPWFHSFDFSASRPARLWKYRLTVGVRLFDAFDTFNPRDVQQNLASPNFGRFFNGVPRDFQTFVEIGR